MALAVVTGYVDLLIVVVSIIVIVMLHELGHFLAAKRGGMKVTEYFVGLRPPPVVLPTGRDRVRDQGPAPRAAT